MKELGYTEVLPPTTQFLPAKVAQPPKDAIKTFSHTKRVGNYLLGKTLGEGSFAKVKEALHVPTGEKVAIKVIDKKRAKADSYVRKNLRREGKLLQMVRHPNVVKLLEIMETENSYYLVTELCQGGDFMDYICKKKKLDEKEGKKYVRQIVSAVDYLHRLGILHRDLKIENLLLDSNKDIKIIDFGLSNCIKVSTGTDGTIHPQEFCVTQCGSPAYAAPELLSHQKYGPQVDVWSIGVNMFAMLTGSLPFTVEPFNIKALHNKMIIGQINPTPDNLTHECRDLLRKLLTPDPAKRVTITDAMKHVWLSEGKSGFFERHPCPNKLRTDELDSNLLKHMCHNLGFRMNEIIRFCTGNVPSAANATYQLFLKKLRRYNADARVKGKVPAVDSRLMEPTKISLVFHDLPHRKAGMVPSGVKLLRRREPGNDIPDIIANSQRSPKITSPRVEKDITVTELDNDKNSSDDSQDTSVALEGKKTPIQIPTAVYASEDYTPVRRSVFKTTNIQRVLCANPTWLRKEKKEKKTMSDELSNINKLLSPQKSTTETEIISNVSGKSSVYVRLGKHLNPTRQAPKSRNSRSDKTCSSSETPVITTVVNRSNSNNISVDLKPMNKRAVQINYLAANKIDSRQSKIDNLRRPVSIAKKSASKNEAVKKSRTVESVKDERLELNTYLVTDRLSDISNSRDSISQNPKGDPDVILPAISPVFSRNH